MVIPESVVFLLLLLLAVVAGFVAGRIWSRCPASGKTEAPWLRQSYFEGLNYLLNEQPDAAIDTFVAALEVNSETLETHFALGSLLRRRGEVDRAIRIHQNLLARPSLTLQQQQQAQAELALDYMRSGLLDRAEALFKELVASDDMSVRGTALERLIDIYRDEKEWQAAIDMAEQLCHRKLNRDVDYWRNLQAQFASEIAEGALNRQQWSRAREWSHKALQYRKDSLRAQLVQARVDLAEKSYDQAVRQLNKVEPQSSLYVSEVLPLLEQCYSAQSRLEDFKKRVTELYHQHPSERLMHYLGQVTARTDGDAAARAFVAREIQRFATLSPVAGMLELMDADVACDLNYHQLAPILEQILEQQGGYECRHCGFVGHQLHWCCPTCKTWGAMSARMGGFAGL